MAKKASQIPVTNKLVVTGGWCLAAYRFFFAAGPCAVMSRGQLAAGADSLLVEVQANPEQALKNGQRAIRCREISDLVDQIRAMLPMLLRSLTPVESAVQASAR